MSNLPKTSVQPPEPHVMDKAKMQKIQSEIMGIVKKLSDLEQSTGFYQRDANLLTYLANTTRAWLASLTSSFKNFFHDGFQRLNFIILWFGYPIVILGLIISSAVLAFINYFGGHQLIKHFGDRWAGGFCVINWGTPSILRQAPIKRIRALGIPNDGQRNFDTDVALSLLAMASAVYERKDQDATAAFQKKDFDARKMSENKIEKIMEDWDQPGMFFTSVSELNSMGSQFCGIFVGIQDNFIVVTFKGTQPNEFREWLIDATLDHIDGGEYLPGSEHRGFFESLFPSEMQPWTFTAIAGHDYQHDYPFKTIEEMIREVATILKNHHGKLPNVWVTGHSLGAALATLFFTGLLCRKYIPDDIPPVYYVLRDCYAFAPPRIGDYSLCEAQAHCSKKHHDNPTLWSVINQADIVPRVPLGFRDIKIAKQLSEPGAVLAYTACGVQVKVNPTEKLPFPLFNRLWHRLGERASQEQASQEQASKKQRVPVKEVSPFIEFADPWGITGEVREWRMTAPGPKNLGGQPRPDLTETWMGEWENKILPTAVLGHFPKEYWRGIDAILSS